MTAGRNKNSRSGRYIAARLKARVRWFGNRKQQLVRRRNKKAKYK